MASILRVDTLTDASSGNSTAMSTVFNGTAKAYSRYDISTNTQNNSYNISSTSDDGTGEFTINFSNNFSSGNEVVHSQGNSAGNTGLRVLHATTTGIGQSGSLECHISYVNGTNIDAEDMPNVIFGDLA